MTISDLPMILLVFFGLATLRFGVPLMITLLIKLVLVRFSQTQPVLGGNVSSH